MNNQKKKIVLILQEEKAVEKELEKMMKSKGYKTICAESELEALSLLSFKKIDAVVSNIDLCTLNSRQTVLRYTSSASLNGQKQKKSMVIKAA